MALPLEIYTGISITGIPRKCKIVRGILAEWKQILRDEKIVQVSRGNVALFDFYSAPATTKIVFQAVEGHLL